MMMDSPNYAKDDVLENHVCHGEVFLPLFVMSTTSQSSTPLCDRLQLLAQKLQQLKDRRHPDNGTMCRGRSSERGISMLVQPCDQAEDQPILHMGDVPEVRPEDVVRGEEGLCWRASSHGPGTSHNSTCDGIPGEGHQCRGCQREDCQRATDGSPRPNAPDGSDSHDGHQHVLHRLHEKDGTPEAIDIGQGIQDEEPDTDNGDSGGCHQRADQPLGEDSSRTSFDRGCGVGEEGSPDYAVHGQSCDQDEGKGSSKEDVGCDVEPRMGGGRDGRDGGGSPPGGGLSQVEGLRQRLSKLQAKINGKKGVHRCPDPRMGTESASTDHQTDGPAMLEGGGTKSYETAGEQYTNSKGLTKPVDESCNASAMKFLDEHGNQVSGMTSINMDKPPTNMTSDKNAVLPSVAKKIARNAAVIGCLLMAPVLGMFGQLQNRPDFMEIACSANSALSQGMEDAGYHIKPVNYLTGYDLGNKKGTSLLRQDIALHTPRFGWVSLPCTRLSSLVNLTQRSDEEWASFLKRQLQDIKRASEVAEACEPILQCGDDLAWEWPASATPGWKSHTIRKLLYLFHKHKRTPYWCRFDGCAYGLSYNNVPVRKGWMVLTTNKHLWLSLQKRCPGHEEHCECRGPVAQASAYYPKAMVTSVIKAIQGSWQQMENEYHVSISKDVETYLLECNETFENDAAVPHQDALRQESPGIFALTRNRYPSEPPTGKKLEQIKQQMMRIHRASGHVPFSRLQKLLAVRKAPAWAIELAGNLQCPSCTESKRAKPASVASLKETPSLFEIVGMEIFEFEHGDRKHKRLLIRDRASGLVMVEYMKEYEGKWEPNSDHIINAVCKWLMHNPKPQWVITDSATYFTSEKMLEFYGMSGVGVLTTPAEAHEMLGAEESCIRVIKETAKRLIKEDPEIPMNNIFQLAAHGCKKPSTPLDSHLFSGYAEELIEINLFQVLTPRRCLKVCCTSKRKPKQDMNLRARNNACQSSTTVLAGHLKFSNLEIYSCFGVKRTAQDV